MYIYVVLLATLSVATTYIDEGYSKLSPKRFDTYYNENSIGYIHFNITTRSGKIDVFVVDSDEMYKVKQGEGFEADESFTCVNVEQCIKHNDVNEPKYIIVYSRYNNEKISYDYTITYKTYPYYVLTRGPFILLLSIGVLYGASLCFKAEIENVEGPDDYCPIVLYLLADRRNKRRNEHRLT